MSTEQPLWTITEKPVNMDTDQKYRDPKKPSYTEYHLRFEGKKLFTAKTPIAHEELKLLCEKWNKEQYRPVVSSTKLLHEMAAKEREKIQSYSPALPFGTGGES